jgi:hypothetical protein
MIIDYFIKDVSSFRKGLSIIKLLSPFLYIRNTAYCPRVTSKILLSFQKKHLFKTTKMKKLLFFLSLATTLGVQAQTSTLKVLIDSLPNGGYGIIESFNGKLYTLPAYQGGTISEINTTTGVLTNVATLPALGSLQEYATYSGNFVFLKGKTVASIFNSTTGGETYHIAAGIASVDTLLKNHSAFCSILNVDTMVYILSKPNGLTVQRLYATNLAGPISLIDSNINNNGGANNQLMKATTQKKMYYVIRNAANTDYILKYSNGITKTTLETLTNFAAGYGFSLLGEVGSDMYYTTYHRNTTMDTTWVKKCDNTGVITIVDTILRKSSFPTNSGLVMNANKLIIPFTNRIVVYDLTTKSKEDILPGKVATTYNWSQDYVAKTHFYFNIPASTDSTYISDGTAAGTIPYKTNLSNEIGARFETYGDYQLLGNKAIICDEYPIANRTDELYIGNATNAAMYKLYADRKSYPSHFEKVDGALFFTIRDNTNKVKLMKLEGCDLPTSNPLGIKNDFQSDANKYTIYPNPNNGIFIIEQSVSNAPTIIEISNILGQMIFSRSAEESKTFVDISNQSSGVYFLKILQSGELIGTQKLLKQ